MHRLDPGTERSWTRADLHIPTPERAMRGKDSAHASLRIGTGDGLPWEQARPRHVDMAPGSAADLTMSRRPPHA